MPHMRIFRAACRKKGGEYDSTKLSGSQGLGYPCGADVYKSNDIKSNMIIQN